VGCSFQVWTVIIEFVDGYLQMPCRHPRQHLLNLLKHYTERGERRNNDLLTGVSCHLTTTPLHQNLQLISNVIVPNVLLEKESNLNTLSPLIMATISHSISPSESKLTLLKATVEDIPAIKAMVDAAYSRYIDRIGKAPAPMTEDWYQVIRTHEILILRDNKRILGSITFHKNEPTNSLKIDNVVVDPTA
jgi:hypothetical protein